jgi:hypothetical protein
VLEKSAFEIDVLSMLGDIDRRLTAVEHDLRAIADAERAKHRYINSASDAMRRATDHG